MVSGEMLLHDRVRLPLEDVRRSGQHPGRDGRFLGRVQLPPRLPQRFRPGAATLWVENAFDEEYFERGWENADADNQFGYGLFNELVWPARPRTVGVTIGMDWK